MYILFLFLYLYLYLFFMKYINMYDTTIIILILCIMMTLLYIVNIQNSQNIIYVKPEESEINVNEIQTNNRNNNMPNFQPIPDPIAKYDLLKLTDPLIDPSQRTSIDQIPSPYFAPYINFPSRGVVDKFHRVGLLIRIDEHKRNYYDDNENDVFVNTTEVISTSPVINPVNNRRHDKLLNINNTQNNSDKKIKPPHNVKIEPFGNSYDNNILELMGMKLYQNTFKYFTSLSEGNKNIKITVKTQNDKELYDGDVVFIPELRQKYRVKIDDIDGVQYNPYFF
jgi:hypothetical protein